MTGGRSAFADIAALFLSKQVCIRVRQLREVGRAGPGVQLGEERVFQRLLRSFATFDVGSLMSPKTSASVGHTCWQAVRTSPSLTRRFSFSASMRARFTRWMQ